MLWSLDGEIEWARGDGDRVTLWRGRIARAEDLCEGDGDHMILGELCGLSLRLFDVLADIAVMLRGCLLIVIVAEGSRFSIRYCSNADCGATVIS